MTTQSDEIKQLMPKIDNIHTLAGLLSTQDLTQEHPEYALMFLQRAFELGQQELEAVKLKLWKEIDLMFHGYWRNNLENLTKEVQENLVRMRELFGVEHVDGEWKSKQAQGGE